MISKDLERLLRPRKNLCVLYFYVFGYIFLLSHIVYPFEHFREQFKRVLTQLIGLNSEIK